MKIIALSDLHGFLPENINECDIVCIAGDISPLNIQRDTLKVHNWIIKDFIPWAENLPCDEIILVAGNHDFYFDPKYRVGILKEMSPGAVFKNHGRIVYLRDESYVYNGIKFYGTPWVTGLDGWAFNIHNDEPYMKGIPNCDVLISHAPPSGLTGTVLQHGFNYMRDFGSQNLYDRLQRGGIKHSISGHIHSGAHGEVQIFSNETDYCRCWNVSILDENYLISYMSREFEI